MDNGKTVNVVITSYLEPEYVEKIRRVDPRLNVVYRPELIPSPRYAADHTGIPPKLPPEQEAEWEQLLGQAEVLFDFDYSRMDRLANAARKTKWIQATSAGIGQMVHRMRFAETMPGCVFTTASGVHARPLAEFVVMALLMHYKNFGIALEQQRQHLWKRYSGTDLEGRTIGVVGLGRIGSLVARFLRSLDMRVLGSDVSAREEAVDVFYPPEKLSEMLPQLDALVVTVPHTPETEKMFGRREFGLLPKGAFFVNIARGAVVDEPALIEALSSGHLSGAALDVAAVEPLPADSPLWDMPRVVICPHSASTSDKENGRIVDLFVENLRRYLDGRPLLNVLNVERMY